MIRKTFSGTVLSLASSARHLFGYLLNDPTTPELSEAVPIPPKGLLNFSVDGLPEEISEPKNSSQRRSSNCHVLIGNCLNNIQKHSKTPIRNWASVSDLKVCPMAGQDMNAYYDRRSLRFFYYPYSGRNVYFADSADIVAHELGHAFLDAMRPDFWSVQSLEIWSFHEAFSDIVAMFNIMSHEKAIEFALEQTNGNMEKSNVISKLAEEVGNVIKSVTKDPSYLPNALRDPALEHFNYSDPCRLPADAPNNMLASECHSFGRVFSGAWYKIFVKLFEMHSESADKISAFKLARDEAFSILMHSIPSSPRVEKYYSAVARAMCVVARSKNERTHGIVESVFREFNILDENSLHAQSNDPDLKHKIISKLSRNDKVIRTRNSVAICLREKRLVSVQELPIASSLSVVKQGKIEVPSDTYYEFDGSGNLVAEILPDNDSIMISASKSLLSISDQIGSGKMWDFESGVLKRRFIK